MYTIAHVYLVLLLAGGITTFVGASVHLYSPRVQQQKPEQYAALRRVDESLAGQLYVKSDIQKKVRVQRERTKFNSDQNQMVRPLESAISRLFHFSQTVTSIRASVGWIASP